MLMNLKKVITLILATGFLSIAALATYIIILTSNLPQLITVADYSPLLVSEVFDRNNQKIGEFFRERRLIAEVNELPEHLLQAFVASEDASFYEHNGVNYIAMVRALIANIKAGRKVQGASTITQQVARSLLLTNEKTYTRKIKEIILAQRMEENLTKDEILYLYLNQIYLGHGAYGVKTSAQIYFRKSVKDLTLGEAAVLAGLPQAPSRYSPVYNPQSAKTRQRYVLSRMVEEGFVTEEQASEHAEAPLTVYVRRGYKKFAPFYLETIRQMLVEELGEEMVLDKGLKIHTSLDIQKQIEAQRSARSGLRQLDKRQGYRGPKKNITDTAVIAKMLKKTRDSLVDDFSPAKVIHPDGQFHGLGELNLTGKDTEGLPVKALPKYIPLDTIVEGIITKVDDKWGLVYVRFAESQGLIDFETMKWARTPDPKLRQEYAEIDKPSKALKVGDIISVRVVASRFYSTRLNDELKELKKQQKDNYLRPEGLPETFEPFVLIELEQEPLAQAALISLDQKTSDVVAMVGGYDFKTSQFNRALQALRQPGSSFKTLVYAAALDKGFTPATKIIDAPLIYEEEKKIENSDDVEIKKWKPGNYSHKFTGDILFRNALIRSLNVPTVKIIEKVSVDWVAEYAKRLGVFSPLNMDFTLALGSSAVTLYEMTKVFAQFGRLGKRITPVILHKVLDREGVQILGPVALDKRFSEELEALNEDFKLKRLAFLNWRKNKKDSLGDESDPAKQKEASPPQALTQTTVAGSSESAEPPNEEKYFHLDFSKQPPLYYDDPEQLMSPATAFIITSILQGVIEEPGGTGRRARALGRPAAGKTGTTSGYYDAWFVGYTPDIVSGVWVGYDDERSLGVGEGGGRTALPIWLEYMKSAQKGLPERNFPVPEGIVFANIDNETGDVASAQTASYVKQAFVEGTEPQFSTGATTNSNTNATSDNDDIQDFYKQDLSE